MTPQPSVPASQRRRTRHLAAVIALLCATAWAGVPGGEPVGADVDTQRFPEVGRLPLYGPPSASSHSGWLILNPASRRGYQIFEDTISGEGTVTTVQSFDLDTLRPLRRANLAGMPITGGTAEVVTAGGTGNAAEVVHAVDPVRRRIYLALSQSSLDTQGGQLAGNRGTQDAQRPLARFVMIDEDAFDRCAGTAGCAFAASFREPTGQEHLHFYWPVGMAVSRVHVKANEAGRLLVLFAGPNVAPLVVATPPVPLHDHTLVQWDPSGLSPVAGEEAFTRLATGTTVSGQLQSRQVTPAGGPARSTRRLEACRTAPLASLATGDRQWGLLPGRDAVWTGCQASEGAGVAVRVALDADGHLDPAATQETYRMSRKVTDVLTDEGGGRLLLGSPGDGHTWWAFDTNLRRFTGSVAAIANEFYTRAAGVDPTTGRLYQLSQDHEKFVGTGPVPFRGGFAYSDTRLYPAPPLENARPDLAYPAGFAIRVDPPTRRVFVRFGDQGASATPKFPGTNSTTPASDEAAYRVLLDDVPITEPPAEPDDAVFTTDVSESNLTRASYLGTGSGYGVRTWLVGGADAATSRTALGNERSPCGRDDREVLAGSVGAVEVSDLSTRADAASLDGDAKTQDHLRAPANRCTPPELGGPLPDNADTTEVSFGPEGKNLYRTSCTGDETAPGATAPPNKVVPRDRFEAGARCDHAHGAAEASATGGFGARQLDSAQGAATVGYAHSEVTVRREAGRGVTVKVDSIARDVVVPGVGTIGLVRGEATVTSTGRPGGATARYKRTVCDWHIGAVHEARCRDETSQEEFEAQMNQALGSRGRVRFRPPDPVLQAGSRSGYKAGVQRPESDGFEDTKIARDASLALPAMELVLYNGDSSAGTGRQFLHLAGVQAGTSYGIACLYGQRDDGRCAGADEGFGEDDVQVEVGTDPGEPEVVVEYVQGEAVEVPGPSSSAGGGRRSLIRRIVEAPVEFAKDVLRLLFANPREFGLMAAVWALLFAPCYLGERRRSIGALRARRAAVGT